MRKPRLLLTSECSYLDSGYGTYTRNVQKILVASGKYEVAELAAYHDPQDPVGVAKAAALPWKVYPNIPGDATRDAYNPKDRHQYGEFSFARVALDFRPDVVWDVRDWWMLEFVERSPYRRLFNWVVMPTCDAAPQSETWLATYSTADAVLSYTDWGADTLRREGGGLINVVGSAPPAADTEAFRPLDRAALRAKHGIPADAFVVGTIMRNQPRKLYQNLVEDFGGFLRSADPDLAARSLLYLHTSYPDKGWDIPRLIKHSGFSHKILVTYRCKACGKISPSRYSDARARCRHCGALAAGMPHVRNGVETPDLAEIINLFDAYAQYANSEGFGMPQVEAASCGVPVFATDYSAMSDVVRKVAGFPIRVDRYLTEHDSGCLRAIPSGADFAGQLAAFAALGEPEREALRARTRAGVLEHYTWEKTAAKWMKVFDSLPPRPLSETWESPPRLHTPVKPPAEFPDTETCVRWCLEHYMGRPDLVGSHTETRLIRDLNWGSRVLPDGGSVDFNEDGMLAEMAAACEAHNEWERKRRPAVE